VVWLEAPPDFRAVGEFFQDFSEVTDDDVIRLLAAARTPSGSARAS
jgi:predicted phosphoribosyltransferase